MLRLPRLLGLILGTITLLIGITTPAVATEATSTREAASCDGNWHKTGDIIGEWISPWIDSVNGIGFSRQIQFKALGGVSAVRGTPPKCNYQKANFVGAVFYRTTACLRAFACTVTAWTGYSPGSPTVGYRFPGKVAGWDPFALIWHPYANA